MIFIQLFFDNLYDNFLLYPYYIFIFFLSITLAFVLIHFFYKIMVVSKVVNQIIVQITQPLSNSYRAIVDGAYFYRLTKFKRFRL